MASGSQAEHRPKALVYRGPAASPGCPESVGRLLETSPYRFEVTYAGPNETVDVTEESLTDVVVYAFPGGPDLDDAYELTKAHKKPVQDFVAAGGHYMGFCLGAYLAGRTPGYDLLPPDADTDSEIEQAESQVTGDEDTFIQVDWSFSSRNVQQGRWLYFQEGALIDVEGVDADQGRILARYSKSGHVAASVTKYGDGWVGLVGPHPEADERWYADVKPSNPDGLAFDVGYDFIKATLNGGRFDEDQAGDGKKIEL